MVTLIRTLKRINKSAPPALAPAPPPQQTESSKTKITAMATAQTPRNIAAGRLLHFHHGSQLKETTDTATGVINLNVQGRAIAPSDNQNQNAFSTADRSNNFRSVVVNSGEKNNSQTQSESDTRKRKSSSSGQQEDLSPTKVRKKYECSADGCTNHAVKGGVCLRHGAQIKLCRSEGCIHYAKKGGVCWRHGANKMAKK